MAGSLRPKCQRPGCRARLKEGARADKEYCSGRCRAAAQRAAERAAELAAEPSAEELVLSALYDARGPRQPLQVDERLSLRARWIACEEAVKHLHERSQRQQLPYGDSWRYTAVVPEDRVAAVAAKARALGEPEASHLGLAVVPLGGGLVCISIVIAAPRGARVMSSGGT